MSSMLFAGLSALWRSSRLGRVALAGCLLLASGSVELGQPAQALGARTCPTTNIGGQARGSGEPLRRYAIILRVHGQSDMLAHQLTSRKGRFSLKTCRTYPMKTYASQHHGLITFDVIAHVRHGKGAYWTRTVTVPLTATSAQASGAFAKAKGYKASTSGRTTSNSFTTGQSAGTNAYVHPTVMFVQAVPHMQANYQLSSGSLGTMKAVVGLVGGGWGGSGTLSISGSAGFSSERKLRSTSMNPRVARVIRPVLDIDSQYTCGDYPQYWGGGVATARVCIGENMGHWTGHIETQKANYVKCGAGPADPIHINNQTSIGYATGTGQTYTSEVSMGGFGSSFTATTQYTSDTYVKYVLDQTTTKHRFCIGGNNRDVATSSALYINDVKKSSGPGCRRVTPRTCSRPVPAAG